MTTTKSECSDSTNATTDRQDRLEFLKEKSRVINDEIEALKTNLIIGNDEKLSELVEDSEEFQAKKQKHVQNKLQNMLQSAKKASLSKKIGKRVVEDPREGLTRRYANYIPIPRYQFTEDTLNIFYPNVDNKFYTKLSDTWNMDHEDSFLRNTIGREEFENKEILKSSIDEDLTLYTYIQKFGENDETIEAYKQFTETHCENKGIVQRYRAFHERISKKRTTFHTPGISVKSDEELNEMSIIKTHKELFCRRCEVYDCGIHGILDAANIMHPQLTNSKELLASYNQMVENSSGENKEAKTCGPICYMKESTKEKEKLLSEAVTTKIKLGLQIFKFEPCNIRLYFNKEEVTCHQIYQYLKIEYSEIKTLGQSSVLELLEPPSISMINEVQEEVKSKQTKKPKVKGKGKFFESLRKPRPKAQGPDATDYKPCYHRYHDKGCSEEEKSCTENCACFKRGFCDKYCGCDPSKCKIRRKGCDCKGNCLINKCVCYMMNAECDPDLCKGCFDPANAEKCKSNECQNQMVYFNKRKLCKVGPSEVCTGLGLFNIEPIKKGEFVTIYIGELISWDEALMREQHNFYDQETYLCTVTDEHVVDAKYRGNKARFINHGKGFANLVAKNCFSKGVHHFAFYAKDDIAPGTELLFDYEGGGSALREQFPWIRQPNPPKQNQQQQKAHYQKEDSYICKLKSGAHVSLGFKMLFTLNAKPRKLIKVERNQEKNELKEEEYGNFLLRDMFNFVNREEEYCAYEETPGDEENLF